jgi:hypothetical protein
MASRRARASQPLRGYAGAFASPGAEPTSCGSCTTRVAPPWVRVELLLVLYTSTNYPSFFLSRVFALAFSLYLGPSLFTFHDDHLCGFMLV